MFVTAGMTASAAVLAMSLQATAQSDDGAAGTSYGDTSFSDPEPDESA